LEWILNIYNFNQKIIGMKKLVFLFLAVGIFSVAQAQTVKLESGKPGSMAKFEWTEKTHDFGKITQGNPVSTQFSFKNTGGAPLIINSVKGSCGCTVVEYTKEPIPPGKTGFVKAKYNAAAMGTFNKSITVTANIEGGSEILFIKGEVTNSSK
jgi:hypothetical protein